MAGHHSSFHFPSGSAIRFTVTRQSSVKRPNFTSGPFFGANGDGTTAQTLFFSFTTLTTTGYGNLIPATRLGQSLAVLEMLVGQLFLVTALAKIVSAWRPSRWGMGGEAPPGTTVAVADPGTAPAAPGAMGAPADPAPPPSEPPPHASADGS